MYLEWLELADFRSYGYARVDLEAGANVLVGANAQGKTNLLEAVHWLAVGASHRVAGDVPLVRSGAPAAVVRAQARLGSPSAGGGELTGAPGGGSGEPSTAQAPGRLVTVEVELRPGGRNRARVNGQGRPRVRDAIGLVRSVMFAPEDLALIRGEPAARRRFLDELLGQRRPAYLAARQEFERILRQRNALLRQSRGAPAKAAGTTLATWTDALVRAASTLLAARLAVIHALARPAAEAYAQLVTGAPGGKAGSDLALVYELSTGRAVRAEPGAGVPDPGDLAAEFRDGLERLADDERERGLTLAGPHRDELRLELDGLVAKSYASQGESWSVALALRLASREVLREVGEEPVVLLDDVFAELDEPRRAMLAERCAGFEQVLVTAAVEGDVPLAGTRFEVEAGRVRRTGSGRPPAGDDAGRARVGPDRGAGR